MAEVHLLEESLRFMEKGISLCTRCFLGLLLKILRDSEVFLPLFLPLIVGVFLYEEIDT